MTTERSHVALEPLARGALALVLAVVVTFSPDHSPAVGLTVFGGWSLLTGLALLLTSRRTRSLWSLAHGAAAVSAGLVAIGVLVLASGAAPQTLVPLLAGFAAVSGALDIASGIRGTAGRDGVVVGSASVLLALLVLGFPADPVFTVGLLGAWAAVVGVYLVIGALSVPETRKAHSA
ncbi:MAG TPA: DUF308 domain-containing protein [Naasia sp.]|jgi:uncharacterized membrane protein HdeD (DUF308 family)